MLERVRASASGAVAMVALVVVVLHALTHWCAFGGCVRGRFAFVLQGVAPGALPAVESATTAVVLVLLTWMGLDGLRSRLF